MSKKKPNVLVLCYGNVNRSPLFEAVLRKRGYPVKSAGFYKDMGKRAAKKTRDFAKAEGYDLTEHRSQAMSVDLLKWAQYVVCMGESVFKRFMGFTESLNLRIENIDTKVFPGIRILNISDPGFLSGSDPKFVTILSAVIRAAEAFNE